MKFGIIPNISKKEMPVVLFQLIKKIEFYKHDFFVDENIVNVISKNQLKKIENKILDSKKLITNCDIVISIGGDGTMLNTAFETYKYGKPLIGLNIGKLGFLAEFDINNVDVLFESILNDNLEIENRIALEGKIVEDEKIKLFAVNDIVIEKGPYPKMIKLRIEIDDNYVTTFSADGLILATPTGSTGYSLSTGGPVVSPKADVITLSPISPHTLTMRHLVISTEQKIKISVETNISVVQINCDGQRVIPMKVPGSIIIKKSKYGIKLMHLKNNNYFRILRKKLMWGIDLRNE